MSDQRKTDSQTPGPPTSGARPDGPKPADPRRVLARFGVLLALARGAVAWESFWPAIWPLLGVAGLFLALAFSGILPDLAGWLHSLVLAAFAAAAVAAVTEGHRLALELGHTRWAGRFEVSLASMHSNLRQFDQAAEYARSGLDRALRTDDRRTIVHAALVLHSLPPAAVPHPEQLVTLESALALSRDLDDAQRELGVLATLAVTAVQRGDTSAAAEWIRARQQRFRRLDLLYGLPISVMLAVEVAKLRGDLRTGARLHGAVAAHAEPLLAIMAPGHAALYRRSLETIRMQLGRTGFDAATAEGATLGRDGTLLALATYLDEIDDSSPSAGAAAPNRSADGLTAREAQVLALLVRGLRNKEIATDLRITPKTVMHHTGAIYRKLGVRNRAEAATAAARRGLVPLD